MVVATKGHFIYFWELENKKVTDHWKVRSSRSNRKVTKHVLIA